MNNKTENRMIGPSKDFELIKKLDDNGVEYWTARELMKVLQYSLWQNFEIVIKKAEQSCVKSRQFPQDHFIGINKMVGIGSKTTRKVRDYKLDRYACYLIAQNGDSSKQAIATAQTYFAVQTRRQEIQDALSKNNSLLGVAKEAGVSKFGVFDDVGYQGLYGMKLSEVERIKGAKKGELFDYLDSEELGANIFRITQTEAKLKKDGIKGDIQAQTTHFKVGSKIRQTMKELGSEMPENLKPLGKAQKRLK